MRTELRNTRDKFDILNEYSGFTFRRGVGKHSTMFQAFITYPNGEESIHAFGLDKKKVIDPVFESLRNAVLDMCESIERKNTG